MVRKEDTTPLIFYCCWLQSAGQGGDFDGEDDLAAPFVPLEFELDDGPCIEALIHAYPNSVVGSLLRIERTL